AAAAAGQPLDHNLTQIGAPAAWQAGDTGRGVTVAVLDTGIDASHPDLQGQITAEQNFTDSPDTVDQFGHGTFVAGEVAGTGAASGGARRGVAFGARLAIGKVLSDDGSGDDSTVLAGMQWAASTAGAKVISMSLGSDSPSDGTDPLSEALNQLSAADHVLFVVAAGNAGPADQTVGSPGAADAALTVGAVDGTGTLASFSSRGPRPGDGAIKPEIMAPGVDIAGLRAAGTALGPILSPSYVTLSGTSMATPEVAGAAADLFQAHPGWSPEQIKADLVDTAAPASGGDLFQVGEGVLSIGVALASPVVAGQATVNAGNIPFGTTRPVTGTLTWTNPSGQPVTLKLSADLENRDTHATPAGAIGLSSRQLTVPAGGTASATVSLDPAVLDRAPGFYEGHVVARAGQQAVTVTVPVGAFAVPQLHQLTLRATALPGTAAGQMAASAQVINVDDPDLLNAPVTFDSSGTGTIQVPPGRYWVIGEVDDLNPDDSRSALVGPPEVTVTRDTTVLLDGARAVPEKASVTGHRTLPVQMTLEVERAFAGQIDGFQFVDFSPGADPHLYAQPSGRVSVGTYTVISTYRLASPADVTQPYVYDLVKSFDHDPASLNDVVGPAQQARLARIDMRFSAVGGDHSDMSEDRIGIDKNGFGAVENPGQVPGGSARTDFITPGNGITQWTDEASAPVTLDGQKSVLDWVIENPHPEQVTAGARSVEAVAREPFAPGPESATFSATSFCQPLPSTRRVGDIHVELTDLQDLPDEFDCLGGSNPNPGWNDSTSRTMTLSQDGKVLGTEHASAADFNAPATAGTFRLTYTDDTSAAVPVSTRTDTAWTFRSAPAAGTAMDPLPLLLVGYDLPLNLDNHPDGQNAVLTVARVAGTTPAPVTSVRFWTSTDQGKTWQAVTVRPAGPGRYAVTLPKVSTGQSVSLRASASDAGGSSVDQTIITAYTG
ncbi:MAG: S8 family serine peptidase, partial [Actinomycetota bacterium]|nr:S8 family serine peptidase [Actinomycetota bacterium]